MCRKHTHDIIYRYILLYGCRRAGRRGGRVVNEKGEKKTNERNQTIASACTINGYDRPRRTESDYCYHRLARNSY